MMKRREFVSLISGAAASAVALPAAVSAAPNPAEWLRCGPMLGRSEITETEIWVQTQRPCRAEVRFWKKGDSSSARLSAPVQTSPANDHIARFVLPDLEFGTHYDYELYLDGLRVPFAFSPAFQTQSHWRFRTDPPAFRMAIGSCAYINDAPYDRPGAPYGAGYEIFQSIARQQPDAMLWLGDNIYFREPDWLSETAMRYRYAHGRSIPELRELLASTHHYAIWDDHDFGPDDSDSSYRTPERALKIFKDYWANAAYGTTETPGVFSRFEWNDVEFFLLDDRYYRSPNRALADNNKVMFGEKQMRWLMDALVSSNAPFKIIAAGNQMMNPITPMEAFGNYPREQRKLIDFIREARVPGVLFLSGDRHHSELIRRVEPGLYPLYDFTSSPLTSGPAERLPAEENNPARVQGTWLTGVRNFGLIEASGPAANRKLTLRTLDTTGKERWRHEVSASELRFP